MIIFSLKTCIKYFKRTTSFDVADHGLSVEGSAFKKVQLT